MGTVEWLKSRLRHSAPRRWWLRHSEGRDVARWRAAGSPMPPPQGAKHEHLRALARRHGLRILVETGTHLGGTLAACLDDFERLYSIELSDVFHAAAVRRFAGQPKVRLFHGNSAGQLAAVLARVDAPALFWLDAHYSGGATARGPLDSPVEQELLAIAERHDPRHVIAIDDARCFDGRDGYLTLEGCRAFAQKHWPHHAFTVRDDMIVVEPALPAASR